MGIKLKDFDQVEAWKGGGGMLPPGKHHVEITETTEGTSSGGHDQIEIQFEAVNGTGGIKDWIVFAPAALGKARMLLEAVGIVPQGGDWEFPTGQLSGKKLTITVIEEPDRRDPTKTRRRVAAYEEGDKGGAAFDASEFGPKNDDDLPF
jgi:hypothetical protein